MSFRTASAMFYSNTTVALNVVIPPGTVPSDTVLLAFGWGSNIAAVLTVTPPPGIAVNWLVTVRNNNNMGWAIPKLTGLKAGDVVTIAMSISSNKVCQVLVLTSDVGLMGAIGTRAGVSLATCIAPGIVSTVASSVFMFAMERTTANPTTVSSVVSAAGDTVTTRSYLERIGDPDISFFLGEFNNSKNPTDTATVTYSGASGNGIAFLFQSVPATPDTIDSDGVRFWDGAAWIAVAKGPKGAKGATGPAGTSTPPVKSFASRNLAINGSQSGTLVANGWWLQNLSTRADEINSPIAGTSGAYSFVNPLPWSYLVTVEMRITNYSGANRLVVQIVRYRADSVAEEISRHTKPANDASFNVSAVYNHINPADKLLIMGYSQVDFGAFTSILSVAPIGPLTLPAQVVDHVDYTSAGTRVTSYTLTPTNYTSAAGGGVLADDWMYLIHEHYRETADITPSLPAGWTEVVAPQVSGTAAAGLQWSIWRKKRVSGETGYTVGLSTARYVRATLITVRQRNDDMPIISALAAPRAAANPSVLTVPGGIQAVPGALIVAVALQNTAAISFTPPPTVPGALTYQYSVPASASTTFLAVATQQVSVAGLIAPAVFNWTLADAGVIGGVQLVFPLVNA